MNHKIEIILISIIFTLILLFLIFFLNKNIKADITPIIGFEEFTNANGTWWHIWNANDDYYFDAESGIQFSNHYNEWWTHNIFCGGYKDNQENWQYACLDSLPFTWSHDTDNETYVNITGWRDKSVGGKTVRIYIRYHLKVDDRNLSIQMRIKNIGSSAINNDLGFAWRVKDIKVGNDYENDFAIINGTYYNLSSNLNLNFTNQDNYWIYDTFSDENLYLYWNKNLTHILNVKSAVGQYNAPITLAINIGTLAVGQQKETEMFWKDAACSWSCQMTAPTSTTQCFQESTYTQSGRWNYISGTCPLTRVITGRYNVSSTSADTALSATGGLWTSSSNGLGLEFGQLLTLTVNCNSTGLYSVDIQCDTSNTADQLINVTAQAPQTCDIVSTSKTLTANDNCQNITADDVVLNCAGYKIIDTQTTYITPFGVWAIGVDNVSIKNCNITHFENGINLSRTNNSLVYNTTIIDLYEDTTGSDFGYGIYLFNSNNNNLTNLTLKNIAGICTEEPGQCIYDAQGIYLDDSSNNILNDIDVINVTYKTYGAYEGGIYSSNVYLDANSNNNTLSDLNLSGGASYNLLSINGNNNSFNSSTLEYPYFRGITSTQSNNITNIVIKGNANGDYGIYLYGNNTGLNTLIKNITISNITGSGAYGLMLADTTSWVLTDLNLTGNIYNLGVGVDTGSSNNNITNSTFSSPKSADIKTEYGTNNNNYLINVSFNHTNTTFYSTSDKFYVKWYMQVNVTNQTDYQPQIATVNVSDNYGNSDFYGNTGANGLTSIFEVFQSHLNKTSPYEWNYTTNITANNTDYGTNSTTLVVNENKMPYDVVLGQACSLDFTFSNTLGTSVFFDVLTIPSTNLSANGNNGNGVTEYNLTITATGCTANLSIKADAPLTKGSDTIPLVNEKWSYNSTNSSVPSNTKTSFTVDYVIVDSGLSSLTVFFKFYLNVSTGQSAGTYNNTLSFKIEQS